MFRSTLIAAGAVLLCSTGYSQQQLDPAKIHPVTVPVRDAGVFNWDTKQWVSGPKANRLKAAPYNVFTNTCTWTGGGFYYGHEHCEDVVDTGRIPGTGTPLSSLEGNPTQISGITDDQIINNFQFAYCMFWQTGQVDIKVGFYNNLRGDCAAGIPVSGGGTTLSTQAVPFGTLTAYFDFGSAAGFPLLGSSVNGAQACWIITLGFADNGGFCMDSEGEGTWDNDQMMDLFSWSFQHGNPNSVYGANGPLIQGDASTGGWGSGAYNIPAGTDAFTGQPCGTGFGTSVDGWWLNIDGSAPGVANTVTFPGGTPQTCIGASGFGTNCYWFGGWPANPLGSFWMAMGSVGSCDDCNNRASNYCTAGTSAAGCNALISATGTSSANSSSGFFLSATGVQGQRTGLFYYGLSSKIPAPAMLGQSSSWNCVEPPVSRSQLVSSGGTNGQCDGLVSVDLNARWTAKPAQNPGSGADVYAQLWYRDPANTAAFTTTSRSDAVTWTVCP